MSNNALGTIAGLQRVDYGLSCGTAIPGSPGAPTYGPGYAEIACANGAEGHRMISVDELLPALETSMELALRRRRALSWPAVLDAAWRQLRDMLG